MKTLVIYNSEYGHTKKYAEWLTEELNAEICNGKHLKKSMFDDYAAIVFGGSLYAGRNKAALLLVKHFEQIKNKKVALFTVGMFDTSNEEICMGINKELDKVIPFTIREKITVFHVRGGIDCQSLNFPHKLMMKFAHALISKKSEEKLTDSDKDFLSIYGRKMDFSDKKMLEPVIQFIQS
jgi:menaquinone-dependent protoporphyrinogen IX oxidase